MYFDSATQRLSLGTQLGIAFIPERLWLKTSTVPATYLDEIRVSNQRMPFPSDGKPLVLEPGRNDLSLFFSSVNYDPRNDLLYSYRLDKRDRDWSTPSASRNANYTGLPPGEYRFQVRAVSRLGKAGAVSEFQLVLRPAFWQTAWFRILLVSSIIAVAYGYFRSRLLAVQQEAALQRKMAESEMNLLRSQIKPHFIFNCLSAIDNLIQTNQVDRATAYLAKFARMLRSVIESTRNDTVPIQKDIETMRNYILLEQFMCNGKFEFTIDADPALAGSDVKVPPMIIQPFLENAIRHGLLNKIEGERILRIRIELDQDIVRYTITDNGVGRLQSKEFNDINKPGHESFGIRITADRIRLLDHGRQTSGYKIEDLEEEGTSSGTRVSVWIDTAPK
jgi:two-component sensor histidine kinase